MIVERKYGVGTVIETALVDTADDKAILTGATFADGDMKVSSDQQALTNGAAEYAAFTSGSEEPQPGDTISNNSQTAVVCGCFLTSGTWSGGDASGYIFLEQVSGALASGQVDISGGTSDVMTLSGDTTVRAIVASGYRVLVGLTSTELSCRELTCQIKDQGSDTWLDDGFKVSTYGNANAAHVFDRSTAAVTAAAIRTEIDNNSTKFASIENDTQDIQSRLPAALVNGRMDCTIDATGMESGAITAIWTTALTEAYRSTGAAGTAAELLHEILQNLTEFAISSTTKTVKKFDGSTTAKTYTLDDATNPTSITEAT